MPLAIRKTSIGTDKVSSTTQVGSATRRATQADLSSTTTGSRPAIRAASAAFLTRARSQVVAYTSHSAGVRRTSTHRVAIRVGSRLSSRLTVESISALVAAGGSLSTRKAATASLTATNAL